MMIFGSRSEYHIRKWGTNVEIVSYRVTLVNVSPQLPSAAGFLFTTS
jgi:hypothetical protein